MVLETPVPVYAGDTANDLNLTSVNGGGLAGTHPLRNSRNFRLAIDYSSIIITPITGQHLKILFWQCCLLGFAPGAWVKGIQLGNSGNRCYQNVPAPS